MINDENNELITSPPTLSIAPGGNQTFTFPILCRNGYAIFAGVLPAGVSVFARANAGDAWQNIYNVPLSVSAFAGMTHTFYFKVEVAIGTPDADEVLPIYLALV